MITSPLLLYFSFHALMYGSVRRQLMQEYVQKSISTTLPCSAAGVSAGELNHVFAPTRPSNPVAEPGAAGAAELIIIALLPVIWFLPDIIALLPAIIWLFAAIIWFPC